MRGGKETPRALRKERGKGDPTDAASIETSQKVWSAFLGAHSSLLGDGVSNHIQPSVHFWLGNTSRCSLVGVLREEPP